MDIGARRWAYGAGVDAESRADPVPGGGGGRRCVSPSLSFTLRLRTCGRRGSVAPPAFCGLPHAPPGPFLQLWPLCPLCLRGGGQRGALVLRGRPAAALAYRPAPGHRGVDPRSALARSASCAPWGGHTRGERGLLTQTAMGQVADG